MTTPKILNNIIQFLKDERAKLVLSKNSDDGRINSIQNEAEILELLETKFKIEVPKVRAWYDFSITGKDNNWFPVNIKVTNTKGNDNLSSKLGLYYALTGKQPDFKNEFGWDKFFTKLKENLVENNKDYYFLVVNKSENQDIFLNSLKQLKSLVPNGNNLPFQCHWNKNRIPQIRTFSESKKFLLESLGKSITLRAKVYIHFKELFGEYLIGE